MGAAHGSVQNTERSLPRLGDLSTGLRHKIEFAAALPQLDWLLHPNCIPGVMRSVCSILVYRDGAY